MAKYIPKHSAPVRRRPGRIILPILLAVVVLAGSIATVSWNSSAKYTQEKRQQAVARSYEFYFGSDLLLPGGKDYTLNPGTKSVSFELRNFDGLKASELSVNYTVSVEGASVSIKPHGSDQSSAATSGVLINGGDGKTDVVTISGLEDGKEYTVTAVGSSKLTDKAGEGYTATLSAKFIVKGEEQRLYKNTQIYEDYVLLTLWTKNQSGEFVIGDITGLIPDKTYPGYTTAGYTKETPIKLDENESIVLRYFITPDYPGGAIPVSVGDTALGEIPLS